MSDRLRIPSPMAYPLSCRSSPDPAVYERYSRSASPDLLNSSRHSFSLGDITAVGNENYNSTGRRDSLLSCPSPQFRDYSDFSESDSGPGLRSLSLSMRRDSHEGIIANHKRVSKLQHDLMTANKKIGRMDVLYEETNKRKCRLQEELLEACTKVAKLEATCASYQEKETQLQQQTLAYQQRNSKLELDILSAFKKVSQLESELEVVEEKRNLAQKEHIAAQEKVSLLEAMVDKMKQHRSSSVKSDDFTIARKLSELEATNDRYLRDSEDLRHELRLTKSEKSHAEDELNKSLIERESLNGKLSQTREIPVKQDESVEILLNELNRFKELYQNALKTNPEAGDYKKLLVELETYKRECSRVEEKLQAMLEYESKFKKAKVKEEEIRVELNGAERKLTLAQEQLQKSLKEKATIAMEVGKSNDKGLKIQDKLTSMEKELARYKNLCDDSEKRARESDACLQNALRERQDLAEQCKELNVELQESEIELEQLLTAGEEMKSKLDSLKESATNAEEQCVKLKRDNRVLTDDLEESNAALTQVKNEMSRCKRQLNGYKDSADAWEHKETEGVKRVKQLVLEVEEVNEKLDKMSSEATELVNKLKVCQEEKESVAEELETFQDKVADLESRLNRVEREKNGQESEKNELEEMLNRYRDEIKKLRQELEEQKSESERAFRKSQDDVVKGRQCVKEMEALEAKYSKTAGKLSEIERKYDVVVGERQELRRELLKAESDVTQLERSLNLVNKEKTELLSEVERLSSHKNKQDNMVGKLEKEMLEVRELHEQLVAKNQEDQVKLKKQSQELEAALDRKEAKSTQVDELVGRCEALKLERKELRENLLNVKDQCTRHQGQLDKEVREKENVIDELNETNRKVKRREEEIENLQTKLFEQGEILEKGNRRNREEQGQMRLLKQELEMRVESYEEKCQELESIRKKYESLQQDYDGKKKNILDAESTIGRLETRVDKLEREKAELASEVENRGANMAKQSESVLKLQKQLKDVKESLANSQQHVDELQEQAKRQSDENRNLFKQLAQKNSDCSELETNLKELQSSNSSFAREVTKLAGKCEELENQAESGFREKLKLTEDKKASEEMKLRVTNDVNRLKEQVKEYKHLYETNLKDSVSRKDIFEKKSLQNEELHKKYSKQAIELAQMEKRLDEAKAGNSQLKKDCFMKQTKIAKLEDLLQKTMQENDALTGIEKEFLEAQEELQERNEEIEHLEVDVNTFKLRVCELEASKSALEKSNVILKASNESERLEQALKKIQELENDFQKTTLEKQVLEERLVEAKNLLTDNEAQAAGMTRLSQELQRSKQELSNKDFQLSILNKDRKELKENVEQLKEKLEALKTERTKLTAELKQAQSPKKFGYSRGGLFIGNQEAGSDKSRLDRTSQPSVGPLTSTPLTSPRAGSPHSKSWEVIGSKTRPRLTRKYSLDSLSYVNSAHGVFHGRLSTSMDNLVPDRDLARPSTLDIQPSSDKDVTNETVDVSLESLGSSEASIGSPDVHLMIQQMENSLSPEGKNANRLAEDWESVSDASSAAMWTGDEPALIDLRIDKEGDQGDTASVKDLKEQFEVANKAPQKLTRKSSSLSRTPSLTTLVEKHEEATINCEGDTTLPRTSPISPLVGSMPELNVVILENDTPENAEVKILDDISNHSHVGPKSSSAIPRNSDVIPNTHNDIPKFSTTAPKSSDVISKTSDKSQKSTPSNMDTEAADIQVLYRDKKNQVVDINSERKQEIDGKVKVKDIKSLWEERDTEKRKEEEVVSKRNKTTVRKFSDSGPRKLGNVSPNTFEKSTLGKVRRIGEVVIVDGDSREPETAAKVSHLVNLFSKSS